jgi:hypothetical protein
MALFEGWRLVDAVKAAFANRHNRTIKFECTPTLPPSAGSLGALTPRGPKRIEVPSP